MKLADALDSYIRTQACPDGPFLMPVEGRVPIYVAARW